jgi:hypothetical protein
VLFYIFTTITPRPPRCPLGLPFSVFSRHMRSFTFRHRHCLFLCCYLRYLCFPLFSSLTVYSPPLYETLIANVIVSRIVGGRHVHLLMIIHIIAIPPPSLQGSRAVCLHPFLFRSHTTFYFPSVTPLLFTLWNHVSCYA